MTKNNGHNEWDFVREKFKNYELKTSDELWDKLEDKLDAAPAPTTILKSKKYTILASVAAIIIISLLVFTNNFSNKINTTTTDNQQPIAQVENSNSATILNQKLTTDDYIKEQNSENQQAQQKILPEENNSIDQNVETKPIEVPTQEEYKKISSDNTQTQEHRILPSEKTQSIVDVKETENEYKSDLQADYSEAIDQAGNSMPKISISAEQFICLGEEIVLFVSGGLSYEWSNSSLSGNIYVSPQSTQTYTCIITTSQGEEIERSVKVNVKDCKKIITPNAFTPNGDGDNDVYKASGNEVQDFYMRIISRRGQTVFISRNINIGWDGYFKGSLAETGTYICIISYKDMVGEMQTVKQAILLIR